MGVDTEFGLALRRPERATGLLAVAGVPGDAVATVLVRSTRRTSSPAPWPSTPRVVSAWSPR